MGGTLTLSELEAMAYDLGVDLDPTPVRMTSKPAPARSVQALREFAAEYGEQAASTQTDRSARIREIQRLAETGTASAHELRDQLREVGIDLGHEREDAEDRRHTARHEAAHAAAALALGWGVKWVDVARGQTQVEQPTYASRSRGVLDMDAERATIAAAGAAFTSVNSNRAELEGDRGAVRRLGRTRWDEARAEAELMAKDRSISSLHRALTNALLESPSGRLEGESLRAVVADWEEA